MVEGIRLYLSRLQKWVDQNRSVCACVCVAGGVWGGGADRCEGLGLGLTEVKVKEWG